MLQAGVLGDFFFYIRHAAVNVFLWKIISCPCLDMMFCALEHVFSWFNINYQISWTVILARLVPWGATTWKWRSYTPISFVHPFF